MKKLLSMLGAIGLVATSSASVVACGSKAGDSDASGPSSDDVAKWDAMEIREFENLFEKTIDLMFSDGEMGDAPSSEYKAWIDLNQNLIYAMGVDNEGDGWVPDPDPDHKTYDWQPKDTIDFQNDVNRWWTRDVYNLINYGIDRIKKDDVDYDWGKPRNEDHRDYDTLVDLKSSLELFEDNLSPVKDITVNVKFSEWDNLINKI